MKKVKAAHAVITENCRRVQGGDMEAYDEAARRLRIEYEKLAEFWTEGKGAQIHLELSVEYP